MSLRLEGRAAIVTGAASGIGRATADLFAREGAMVMAVDRPDTGLADAHDHAYVTPFEQDIAEAGAAEKIIGAAVDRFGKLDIIYNNAGVSRNALGEHMTDDEWDITISVNLTSAFKLARAAIPHLRESPAGRIISTASVMARMTDYGLTAYCASKAGVVGMTRTLALELGKFGITVNCIEPGAIQTGMTAQSFANEDISKIWAKKAALRRLGDPIDIARAALFLASDDAGFVSGHSLTVDGGLTLRT
ncbi:SDR family NAD(P)-dependent oxidoreductase [Minwuia sp.]|uniref:SDR family NAD(P)-dependent oxidoreductase n=1 Tax=Minwuia sp. TaxID=2493630 RepID=UPI003A956168